MRSKADERSKQPRHKCVLKADDETTRNQTAKNDGKISLNFQTPIQTHLQPVSTGARKHLVDAQHVEGVGADAHVEVVLSGELGHVLVRRHAGRLERLGGQLLLLVGHLG